MPLSLFFNISRTTTSQLYVNSSSMQCFIILSLTSCSEFKSAHTCSRSSRLLPIHLSQRLIVSKIIVQPLSPPQRPDLCYKCSRMELSTLSRTAYGMVPIPTSVTGQISKIPPSAIFNTIDVQSTPPMNIYQIYHDSIKYLMLLVLYQSTSSSPLSMMILFSTLLLVFFLTKPS